MKSRKLTDGEIDLAKSVFGDAVDYAAVRIVNGKFAFFQSKHTSMAPDGNIYMAASLRADDYSREDPVTQSVFIHEMAHVWQYQNKILHPLKTGAKLMLRHAFRYRSAYPYRLDAKKDLTDYNMEQQASIIQDYFLFNKLGHFRWQGNCKNTLKNAEKARVYEQVLEKFMENPAYARKPSFKAKKPRGPSA